MTPRVLQEPQPSKHLGVPGDYRRYRRDGCRCVECIQAMRDHAKNQRDRIRAGIPATVTFEIAEHGTPRRYNQGCKCDECKKANAAAKRALYGGVSREEHNRQRREKREQVKLHAPAQRAVGVKIVKQTVKTAVKPQEVKFVPPPANRCGLPLDNGRDCQRMLPCPVHD